MPGILVIDKDDWDTIKIAVAKAGDHYANAASHAWHGSEHEQSRKPLYEIERDKYRTLLQKLKRVEL